MAWWSYDCGRKPDDAGLSSFMQRLARAYLNCLEGLPIFGGLIAVAPSSAPSR
ncbi:MAPEG family protein [Mesorhizobium composti]|uniref:MAPEG family protein n=1 Tax=Ollibium composti TaxID=2675109 RepID=A0ABY2Q4G8_9HYPH|nr:MAPEG family protein [Mesorhizobium composti]THF55130.1 MAPEG family protein [Mesorhizobium composti]